MHQDTLAVTFTFTFTFTLREKITMQRFIAVFNDIMLISNFVKFGPAVLELKRVDDMSDRHAHSYILPLLSPWGKDE
jgi:hypothetical protein